MGAARIRLCALLMLAAAGCRRDDLPFDEPGPPPGTFDERLSFSWTGGPDPSRVYNRLFAGYSFSTGMTTIGTEGDSLGTGRLQIILRGGGPGTYRYRVNGGTADTDQVFIRFVPEYVNGVPSSEYLLTGRPADSLEAEVVIRSFGAVGDSIAGTFAATLGGTTRILMYDGAFVVRRSE